MRGQMGAAGGTQALHHDFGGLESDGYGRIEPAQVRWVKHTAANV